MSKITIDNFIPRKESFIIGITEKTKGGIILPETAKAVAESFETEPQLVLCASPDCIYQKGDYIMLDPHAIQTLILDEVRYIIVPQYRVLGKVTNYTPNVKPSKTSKLDILE